jgi:hypothetical protein
MAFNPLVRFQSAMIPALLKMNRPYLLSQAYRRGENPFDPVRQPLLLTDYDRFNAAKDHLEMIKADSRAAIIHLDKSAHRTKLEEMAGPESDYLLYAAFAKDPKQLNIRNDRVLTEAVRLYIAQETNWQPGRGETIRPVLELNQGELFLKIAYNSEIIKERLSIFEEKFTNACATISPLQPPSGPLPIIFRNSLSIHK